MPRTIEVTYDHIDGDPTSVNDTGSTLLTLNDVGLSASVWVSEGEVNIHRNDCPLGRACNCTRRERMEYQTSEPLKEWLRKHEAGGNVYAFGLVLDDDTGYAYMDEELDEDYDYPYRETPEYLP